MRQAWIAVAPTLFLIVVGLFCLIMLAIKAGKR
jgi:hypothetical protein